MALGTAQGKPSEINAEEWKGLYKLAARQSLLGVVFYGLNKAFPDAERRVPKEVYLRWLYQAESIRGLNQKHYELSRQLTEDFTRRGFTPVVLKGQSNSRLYPDPFIRQTGDVDVYIPGGKKQVLAILREMALLDGASVSTHEVTLDKARFGAEVEVHFDYIQDCRNPFANRRLRRVLSNEIRNPVAVGEGFNVPTYKFSLLMQLSHIRKHLLGLGLGFRQVVDYFVLLRSCTEDERREVAALLGPCGLKPAAGALMWVLSECLGLEENDLLCSPDARRGRFMLRELLNDGNFGKFADRKRGSVFRWWVGNRLRLFRLLPFDFKEVSWYLLRYWGSFLFYVPARITAYLKANQTRERFVK